MSIHNLPKISLLIFSMLAFNSQAEPDSQRQQQLQHLLKHDCGSCHGMTRKGGLGPSLEADRLGDKADDFLFLTIQQGRPGTPMPPWKSELSDDDIRWIIHLLRQPDV